MDALVALLQSWLPDPGSQRLALIGLVAVVAFVFALGVASLVMGVTDPVRRRLGALAPQGGSHSAGWSDAFAEWARGKADQLLPGQRAERDKVQRQLIHAGFRSPNALTTFYGVKTCLGVGLAVVTFLTLQWLPQVSTGEIFFYAMAAGAIGLIAPSSVLSRLVEKRQRRLRNAFPDALDMLVICVEAGLGLTAAIQRVADELKFSHPELAAELALVNAEMRAGVERETALKALTERTGLDDVRGLVSLLVQTLRFGTSIADTLRVYSEEFRDKRMQRAEEQAAKIGTKLIFPLVGCLFPSFFVVAVGPAAIRIIDVFGQLGANVAK